MVKRRRIGILGGTFDPIHLGHLVLAEEAKQLLNLEKVIFVPTHISPHKKRRLLAPAPERFHMVVLATKSNSSFEVSDIELKRGGISYSVRTLEQFKAKFAHTDFYFIVGSDFLEEFSTWKDIESLSKICKFVIVFRPGYPFKKVPKNMHKIYVTALDISSTDIRKRVKTGKTIQYLVPEEVRKYILKKGLYR